jgi:hypothetical protein
MKKCTDNNKKNFFMFRRLMMNYEPAQMDAIHDYLLQMSPQMLPLWEIEKLAEKYRVRKIYEDSRQKQKEMNATREEYDIGKILREN